MNAVHLDYLVASLHQIASSLCRRPSWPSAATVTFEQ